MRSGIAAVIVVVTTAGCNSAPGPAADLMTVRDSAGIRVVTLGALQPSIEVWELEERPDLVIGTLDGSGPDVFGGIADVVQLSDGTLVVADNLAREVRAFHSDGTHAWTAGGRGDGPGEFATLAFVGVFEGDSIGVFDSRSRRVSIFSREGRFVRSYQVALPSELRVPQLAGITRGGSLVGLSLDQPMLPRDPGPYQLIVDAIFVDPTGALLARGPSWPSGDYLRSPTMSGPVAPLMSLPLGRRTQLAVGQTSVIVATQHAFEIFRYDPVGRLREIVRANVRGVPVDAARYASMGGAPFEEFLPDTLPFLNRIDLDVLDRIWVEEFVPPYDDRIPVWWVFGVGGQVLAQIEIPTGFNPHAIGEAHILGVTEDSLGVARVERRRIVR